MSKLFYLFFFISVLVAGAILGVLNPALVLFDTYFKVIELPLSLLLALTFVFGVLVGAMVMGSKVFITHWQLSHLGKKNKHLLDEVLQLKKEKTLMIAETKRASLSAPSLNAPS